MIVDWKSSVEGCILGGAVAEAQGYRSEYELTQPHIASATQLTLFTLEALTELIEWANRGHGADALALAWISYLRWARAQGQRLPEELSFAPPSALEQNPLLVPRHPDTQTLTAFATLPQGTAAQPKNPFGDGIGALTRSAPFGLLPAMIPLDAAAMAAQAAALSHGSPEVTNACAVFALLIDTLVRTHDFGEALDIALLYCTEHEGGDLGRLLSEVSEVSKVGVASSGSGVAPLQREDASFVHELRRVCSPGSNAAQLLALGFGCALYAQSVQSIQDVHTQSDTHTQSTSERANQEAYVHCITLAIAASATPAACASVSGNLFGAFAGATCLNPEWVKDTPEISLVTTAMDAFIAQVIPEKG